MSRFATMKSEESRLESLASSSAFGDLDENDPASAARFMKKMGRELGLIASAIRLSVRWDQAF